MNYDDYDPVADDSQFRIMLKVAGGYGVQERIWVRYPLRGPLVS